MTDAQRTVITQAVEWHRHGTENPFGSDVVLSQIRLASAVYELLELEPVWNEKQILDLVVAQRAKWREYSKKYYREHHG